MGAGTRSVGVLIGSSALGSGGERLIGLAGELGLPLVQRHGTDPYLLPHLIDHGANMQALREAGCDRALAISSVGSLHPAVGVGSLVCPDDYIAIGDAGSTFSDARGHGTRDLAGPWRDEVLAAWADSDAEPLSTFELPPPAATGPSPDGPPPPSGAGVYWQSRGPRFETPAEVRMIAAHADLVGMTVASECVAAHEADLLYAAVCIVDNLANGLDTIPLTLDEFERGRTAGVKRLRSSLESVLPRLAMAGAEGPTA